MQIQRRSGVQALAGLMVLVAGCATMQPLTPSQEADRSIAALATMSDESLQRECESSAAVKGQPWHADPQLQQRYRKAACLRAVVTEQRAWIAAAPCDEIRRRLFQDVPYRPEPASTKLLRSRLWKCKLTTLYFDHLDIEAASSETPVTGMAQAMKSLHAAGEPVVDTLIKYLEAHQKAPFHSLSKPIYGVFRGLGRWLGVQQSSRCRDTARAFLLSLEVDARRAAVEYRGINGFIHGLHDAKCYSGMSILAAREVRVRALRAESEGSTSGLARCRWLLDHGTMEARDDLKAMFAEPKLAAWVDRFSPKCRLAYERLK